MHIIKDIINNADLLKNINIIPETDVNDKEPEKESIPEDKPDEFERYKLSAYWKNKPIDQKPYIQFGTWMKNNYAKKGIVCDTPLNALLFYFEEKYELARTMTIFDNKPKRPKIIWQAVNGRIRVRDGKTIKFYK
jgi:hypothetical protein